MVSGQAIKVNTPGMKISIKSKIARRNTSQNLDQTINSDILKIKLHVEFTSLLEIIY